MRKLFAILLAVLMLTSILAVVPASAATTTGPSLVITEILHNSKYVNSDSESSDPFSYWEIYNNGDESINLYNYSLAMSPLFPRKPSTSSAFYTTWDLWETEKTFLSIANIKPNSILGSNDSKPTSGIQFENAPMQTLEPGETAVIWLVNDASIKAVNDYVAAKKWTAGADSAKEAFFDFYTSNFGTSSYNELFEDTYNPTNAKLYMVWAGSGATDSDTGLAVSDKIYHTDCSSAEGYMYGIVANTMTTADKAVVDGALSEKVMALARFGGDTVSWSASQANTSTAYAPSYCKPGYYIANEKANGNTEVEDYADYKAAGATEYDAESGILQPSAIATPGALMKIQHAYFAADKLAGATDGWADAYIEKYLTVLFPEDDDIGEGNTENKIVVSPPSREELKNRYTPVVKPTKPTDKGCGSSIASGAVVITSILGLGIGFIRKKKEQ